MIKQLSVHRFIFHILILQQFVQSQYISSDQIYVEYCSNIISWFWTNSCYLSYVIVCCVTLKSVLSMLINILNNLLILIERANFIKLRESNISIIYQVKPSFNIQIRGICRGWVDWVHWPLLSQHCSTRKASLQYLVLLWSI